MKRLIVPLLVLVTACSSGSSEPTATAPPTTTSPTPTVTFTPPATAKAMIQALKAETPSVDGVIVYTASTDENHLLGRPGGYKSKGAWRDSRIPASETVGFTLGDIDVGGGIEVFADREGAVERGGRLQAIGPPIVKEYDFVCGTALLRISSYLVPRQAKAYARDLGRILRAPCSEVT